MFVAGLAVISMAPHCTTTASAAAARGSNVTVATSTCTITYPKLGCYVEQGALAYKVTSLITDMSQLACATACIQVNPQYNLLGISDNNKVNTCYCDQGTTAKGTSAAGQCTSTCGDLTSCGGTNAISEFAFSCTAPGPGPTPPSPPTPPPPTPPPGPWPPLPTSPPTPRPGPGPPSGPGAPMHDKKGISLGTESLLILFCGIVIPYLVIGATVKRKRYDATGLDLIPNRGTWRTFFGLVADGTAFAYYTLKNKLKGGGGDNLYERI